MNAVRIPLFALLLLVPSFARSALVVLGNDSTVGTSLDGWNSILVINEGDTYTNTDSVAQEITLLNFHGYLNVDRGRMTPFVVQVHGDDDFTVIAIGSTRVSGSDFTTIGAFTFPFSDTPSVITLPPGDSIATGFVNANVDGSGVVGPNIGFINGGDEMWYTGGSSTAQSGQLILNQAPVMGGTVLNDRFRSYRFSIEFEATLPDSAPYEILADSPYLFAQLPVNGLATRLTAIDPNTDDTHVYTLVSGLGDTHNSLFTISSNQLLVAQSLPAVSNILIRVKAEDGTGMRLEKALVFEVTDAPMIINEFQAINDQGIVDDDGDQSDWFEILNLSGVALDLSGYSVRDDPADTMGWSFPSMLLPASDFLVVFASNKDRSPTNGLPLHTDFRLSGAGEDLQLLITGQTNVVYGIPAREQVADISYGVSRLVAVAGYMQPTPGLPNEIAAFGEAVNEVNFSVSRGFYTNAFPLSLSASIPGSIIRYTFDGSEPSAVNGMIYTNAISVGPDTEASTRGTRIVRAIALHPNARQLPVFTHTYLFVDEVKRQSVFLGSITNQAVYADQMVDALRALPVVSITTTTGNLPEATEHKTVIEYFDPEEVRAGL